LNRATVASLATVLFKSYFRASRSGRSSVFSNPNSIFYIDVSLFAGLFGLIWYFVPQAPSDIKALIVPIAAQAIVGFPVLLTSGVIISGILFELGSAGGLASSEAVNWLPVTPREYVISACISLDFAYSPILALGLGLIVPLALLLGFSYLLPSAIALSLVAFFIGAVIVEAIRSVTNRISTQVYGRSGRFGAVFRIVLLIVFFVVVQLAFQPTIIYSALTLIVSGVSLVWFVPMVWPTVALLAQLSSDLTRAGIFFALTLAFAYGLFELSSYLRSKYWSPVPITINISASPIYAPKGTSFLWLDPIAYSLALKDLRSLVRRKEMTRFLAIPVMLVVVLLIPAFTEGANSSLMAGPASFELGVISTILPIMLSSIAVGQEGGSIANIYMLPVTASELLMGKLFILWLISGIALVGVSTLFQLLYPFAWSQFAVIAVALAFILFIQGFIGLGAGVRHPNFTLGPRARYVTMWGFLVAMIAGFGSTILMFLPLILYFITPYIPAIGPGGSQTIYLVFALTVTIGVSLLALTRWYCVSGVKKFLADMTF
jgi:hypothetical protein